MRTHLEVNASYKNSIRDNGSKARGEVRLCSVAGLSRLRIRGGRRSAGLCLSHLNKDGGHREKWPTSNLYLDMQSNVLQQTFLTYYIIIYKNIT